MGLTLVYFVAFPTPRLMMEFDLLTFSFGQLPLALVTWVPMFLSTLLVPYQALRLWERPQSGGAWTLRVGLGCLLLAAHTVVLGILPVHVAVEYSSTRLEALVPSHDSRTMTRSFSPVLGGPMGMA